MRVTFLGTAAATAMPLPFCNCRICMEAKKFRGKDLRKRASVVVNDDLLTGKQMRDAKKVVYYNTM